MPRSSRGWAVGREDEFVATSEYEGLLRERWVRASRIRIAILRASEVVRRRVEEKRDSKEIKEEDEQELAFSTAPLTQIRYK